MHLKIAAPVSLSLFIKLFTPNSTTLSDISFPVENDDHVRAFQYKHVATWEDNICCAQVSNILIRQYINSNIRTIIPFPVALIGQRRLIPMIL